MGIYLREIHVYAACPQYAVVEYAAMTTCGLVLLYIKLDVRSLLNLVIFTDLEVATFIKIPFLTPRTQGTLDFGECVPEER